MVLVSVRIVLVRDYYSLPVKMSVNMSSLWLLLVLAACGCSASRPVILVHGLSLGYSRGMDPLLDIIRKENPEIEVYSVKAHADDSSLTTPMWTQVDDTLEEIKMKLQSAREGVTVICYSQGGLVCRGIIQTFPDHNIHTFISLSAPLMGQYGVTNFELLRFVPKQTRKILYKWFYTKKLQEDISIANYWNDPYHQDLYHKYCVFLPLINNCSNSEYKKNFLKIKQLVLIGGPHDGVITPWQSSIFGFYNKNNDSVVLDMKDQKEVYQMDSFGLKSLDAAGNVSVCVVPNVHHLDWPQNLDVFHKCIKPWLT